MRQGEGRNSQDNHPPRHSAKIFVTVLSLILLGVTTAFGVTPHIYAGKTQLTIQHTQHHIVKVSENGLEVTIEKTVQLYSNKKNLYLPADNYDITYICPLSPSRKKAQIEELQRTLTVAQVYPKSKKLHPTFTKAGDCVAVKYPYGNRLQVGSRLNYKISFIWRAINLKIPPIEIVVPSPPPPQELKQGSYNIKITYTYSYDFKVPKGTKVFDIDGVTTTTNPNGVSRQDGGNNTVTYSIPPGVSEKGQPYLVIGNRSLIKYQLNMRNTTSSLLNKLAKVSAPIPLNNSIYHQQVFVTRQTYDTLKRLNMHISKDGYIELTAIPDVDLNFIVITEPPVWDIQEQLKKQRISDTPKGIYNKWLNKKTYPTDSPLIKELLSDIPRSPYILDTVKAVVNKVVQTLEYEKDFIKHPRDRLPVEKAIITRKGVCMEYTDLTITMLQALGIAARPAYGYLLYSSDFSGANLGEFGHQWVEVYFPNTGWVPVDPTIAESATNYINLPMAYLFITNDDSALNTYCIGFLSACNRAKLDTTIERITPSLVPVNQIVPIQELLLSPNDTVTQPSIVISSPPIKIITHSVDSIFSPIFELIPLQILWGIMLIPALLLIYKVLKPRRQTPT